MLAHYNLDRHHISSFGEKDFEFGFAGLQREVDDLNLLIHLSFLMLQGKVGDNSMLSHCLKHSMHNSLLSFGEETGVMTSSPQPEHMTL